LVLRRGRIPPVRHRFAATFQVALENKKLLSLYVDDYEAIILRRTDHFENLPGRIERKPRVQKETGIGP